MAEQDPEVLKVEESAQSGSTEGQETSELLKLELLLPLHEPLLHEPLKLDPPPEDVNHERVPDDQEEEDDDEDYPTLLEIDKPSELSTASIEFFEDTFQGATLRTRNVPTTQKQRSTVTSRGAKSLRYKSTVSLTTVVHGFLDIDATPPIPATLIVLDYRLNGLKKGKPNYASVYTELEFGNTTPGAPTQEPFVRAFAPFEQAGFDQETWTEEQIKTMYKISALEIDAAVGKGRVEGDLSQERERTEKKRFFQLFQASYSSIKDGMSGYDTVWWDLRQNEDTKEGVPPTFSTAMLVQRSDEKCEFKARFVMALETGWWTRVRNKTNKWFGVSKDDPLLFDPTLKDKGCPLGVEKNKLGKLMEKGNLSRLAGYKNLVDFGKKSA